MTDTFKFGRCVCCGTTALTSGGCTTCNSSRTFCTCGALVRCGCGRTAPHTSCPNVQLVPATWHPVSTTWNVNAGEQLGPLLAHEEAPQVRVQLIEET